MKSLKVKKNQVYNLQSLISTSAKDIVTERVLSKSKVLKSNTFSYSKITIIFKQLKLEPSFPTICLRSLDSLLRKAFSMKAFLNESWYVM